MKSYGALVKRAHSLGSWWPAILIYLVFNSSLLHAAKKVSIAEELQNIGSSGIGDKPILLMFALIALSLLPFVGMLLTSFVKIAIVLSITRQALGTQQSPPNTVITGLALILTVYVMHPVGMQIYHNAEKYIQTQGKNLLDAKNADLLLNVIGEAHVPMKTFLTKHASRKNVEMFYGIGLRMRESQVERDKLKIDDYLILVPSFVISELTKAFQIGFIIFLPFLIVDMVIANILMALGMQMLSPTTISLPFKILLFVMVDGWHLIAKGLVLGYQ